MFDDWKFWSFFVSALALVLSQFPPISIWFKKAKLELETYSRIHLTHKVGNPNLQIHLIIRNVGGRKVIIKNIGAKIERDGLKVGEMRAQNYIPNPSNNQTLLLTSFSLEPNTEWSNIVNILNYFSRNEERKYREAEKKVKERILELKKELGNDVLVRVENGLISTFNELFESKFIWFPGEYKITVFVESNIPNANISKSYKFILFESQSEEMQNYKKEFSAGAGIYWDAADHSGVIVELEEVNG